MPPAPRQDKALWKQDVAVHQHVAPAESFRTFIDAADAVVARRLERDAQPPAFQPEPKTQSQEDEPVETGLQDGRRSLRPARMQFELHARGVVAEKGGSPRQQLPKNRPLQPFLSLQAAPVILAAGGQDGVAQGELSFREIPFDKIGRLDGEGSSRQFFLREEQAGKAVHQQTGGLGERDILGLEMMLAVGELGGTPAERVMPQHEIVREHADGATPPVGHRRDLKFHVDAGRRSECSRQGVQRGPVPALVAQTIPRHEDVEFQIVVGTFPVLRFQNSPFTAPVASSQQERLQVARPDNALGPSQCTRTASAQVLLEGIASVERKPTPFPSTGKSVRFEGE